MASPNILFFFFFFIAVLSQAPVLPAEKLGRWDLLRKSIGIPAMHMQLLKNDRVIIFDRTDYGASNLTLPGGKCRNNSRVPLDCTAHSVEYDVATNSVRGLFLRTETWCSSGSVFPDGRLVQTGGDKEGERAVRIFRPSDNSEWEENLLGLDVRRWYATNHMLPDGRAIVVGGTRQFNYEFIPKSESTNRVFPFNFLKETYDRYEENNLYPFVHLNVDGNLFIFANHKSMLFDYNNNIVVKRFPDVPDGHPRNYPSTGSSVLLPLTDLQSKSVVAEVLICGGAPRGSYPNVERKHIFGRALDTCGRIRITDPNPTWYMETMPLARVVGDMLLLPSGHVLIINGAANGVAGWEYGKNPVLHPVLYRPNNPPGSRFETQNPATIGRMYHSCAILIRDGRVLVGGSNPHEYYNYTGVDYPTQISLEAFSPGYLSPENSKFRPKIIHPDSYIKISYGQRLVVRFNVQPPVTVKKTDVWVSMVSPSFNTHSFSMNQRLLDLGRGNVSDGWPHDITVTTPKNANQAVPGYYMLFVVNGEIPSEGIWVQLQ